MLAICVQHEIDHLEGKLFVDYLSTPKQQKARKVVQKWEKEQAQKAARNTSKAAHFMRIVYAGTPEFAVPALQALLASGHEVVAVYCQPDRPAGRGRKLTFGPVKQVAVDAGIPVEQPLSLKARKSRTSCELTRLM